MKKPFLYALVAIVYIVTIVLGMNYTSNLLPEENLLMPMAMLSLFVLSVAVMGFLFLYEPLCLLVDGKKKESIAFFGKTLGIFACFVALFVVLVFII